MQYTDRIKAVGADLLVPLEASLMHTRKNAALLWSGGKDSALALYHVAKSHPGLRIVKLLTCVSQSYDRVSMHGVRRQLVQEQADALNLPVHFVVIPPSDDPTCPMAHTVPVCIDRERLSEEHCGQLLTPAFRDSLPASVDPCGERGEYHSFTFDGPSFRRAVPFRLGDVHRQTPFVFRELYPADHPAPLAVSAS
jgi:diphthamide synthase (EF-2-diphthine--ammonia ligase)